MNDEVVLQIKIENKESVELVDLTRSLMALSNQFGKYVEKYADCKENREAKLFVKEIRKGSLIFELIELASVGMIPFMENTNTIIGFASILKQTFEYFLNKNGESPEMSVSDFKDLSTFVNPIAKDNGSNVTINTIVHGDVHLNVQLDSIKANAFQNIAKREIELLKEPEDDSIKTKEVFVWFQARNDDKTNVGNKGIIEGLCNKPLNVIFDNDKIRKSMIASNINPFKTAFVVDVKIQKVQDKPVAYKILRLHENFSIET